MENHLKLTYDIKKLGDTVSISLYDCNTFENYQNIDVVTHVDKNMVKALTNYVEVSNFPIALAYMIVKDFARQTQKRLVEASLVINDKDLRDRVLDYSKAIIANSHAIMSEKDIKEFAEKIKEEIAFLMPNV